MAQPQASTVLPDGSVSGAPATPGASPPRSPVADVEMDDTGHIQGIDGMLDQIAGALARQAAPIIRQEILPTLQRDRAMQRTIGAAAGAAAARKLMLPAVVLSLAAVAIAGVQVKRYLDDREERLRLAREAAEGGERPALPEGRRRRGRELPAET